MLDNNTKKIYMNC